MHNFVKNSAPFAWCEQCCLALTVDSNSGTQLVDANQHNFNAQFKRQKLVAKMARDPYNIFQIEHKFVLKN